MSGEVSKAVRAFTPGWRAQRSPMLFLPAVLGFTLALPSAARTQVLRGYLVDDSLQVAVEGATVSLLHEGELVSDLITDETGWFSFSLPGPGTYQLEAQRLGYARTRSEEITVGASETVTVELRAGKEAIPLDPIVVVAGRGRGSTRFFERMEGWGKGVFFTPAMIDSINPQHPADVLRGQEQTWLSWRSGRWNLVPRIKTYLGSGCVAYMLDGRRIDPQLWGSTWESSPLSWISGEDVIAVEYYRYVGEAPPELRRHATHDGGLCGLLVFWTSVGWE